MLALLLCSVLLSQQETISEQQKDAMAMIQAVNEKAMVLAKSTDHVLVVGSVDNRQIEQITKAADKAVAAAKKIVGWDEKEKEDPANPTMRVRKPQWKGKLLVYVCKERTEFEAIFKKLRNNRPGPNEGTLWGHEEDGSYVLLGPWARTTSSTKRWPMDVEVVAKAASATLTRRHGDIPDWFVQGFGRSLAYRYDSRYFATERNAAKVLVQSRSSWDAWNAEIDSQEQAIIAATLADAMVQSENLKTSLNQMLITMGRTQSFDAALTEVKISREKLNGNWKDWVMNSK